MSDIENTPQATPSNDAKQTTQKSSEQDPSSSFEPQSSDGENLTNTLDSADDEAPIECSLSSVNNDLVSSDFEELLDKKIEARDHLGSDKWLGLHPLSLFINLIPEFWLLIRGLWPLLLVLLVTESANGFQLFDLILILWLVVYAASKTIVHFLTCKYRFFEGRLDVKNGFLYKNARSLEARRIQNMELVQNPFHRIFGLVELRVETAGDASTRGLLSALTKQEAERLKTAITLAARTQQNQDSDLLEAQEEAPVLMHNNLWELIFFGLSKRTVGTVVLITFIFSEVFSLLNPKDAQEIFNFMNSPKVIFGFFLLSFSLSYLWSAGKALQNHLGFKLLHLKDRIQSVEGLLTKRRVEIPLEKIQLLDLRIPLIRRWMGYSTLYIETAAYGIADGEMRRSEGLIPMLPLQNTNEIIQKIKPQLDLDLFKTTFNKPHGRALYRAVIQGIFRSAIFAGLLYWTFKASALSILFFGLIPLSIPIAYLDWQWQGWVLSSTTIATRSGYLNRHIWLLDREKIQSVHIHQDPFMKIHGLGRVHVRVGGSELPLPLVGLEQAFEIFEELREELRLRRTQSPNSRTLPAVTAPTT